jgi:GNAT superfamily N-acetyltransferase
VRALERRHEVLDAVVDSKDHQEALTTVAELLGTSEANAEAVLSLKFSALTKAARDRIQGELENLDATLEWTTLDRPASSGQNFSLRPFSDSAEDKSLFTIRSGEQLGEDGNPWSEDRIEAERVGGLGRIDDESAAWFVAEDVSGDSPKSVGLVFGELDGQEVNVAIWIAPESRKKGYGTACVKHSRRELAAEFPGTVLVVRAPA